MCWPLCKKCRKKIPKYIIKQKKDYKCKCGKIWEYPTPSPFWQCRTCGQTYNYSNNSTLKNITPSCFCKKPDCVLVTAS